MLNMATLNIGTMKPRTNEAFKYQLMRRIDICGVQKTTWKGNSTWTIAGIKILCIFYVYNTTLPWVLQVFKQLTGSKNEYLSMDLPIFRSKWRNFKTFSERKFIHQISTWITSIQSKSTSCLIRCFVSWGRIEICMTSSVTLKRNQLRFSSFPGQYYHFVPQ